MRRSPLSSSRGFSLLEVLISMTMLITGLVVTAPLISVAITQGAEARKRTEGLSLFYTDFDRSRIEVREIEKMGRKAVDSNQVVIDGLEKVGLVWDVVRVSPERMASKAG